MGTEHSNHIVEYDMPPERDDSSVKNEMYQLRLTLNRIRDEVHAIWKNVDRLQSEVRSLKEVLGEPEASPLCRICWTRPLEIVMEECGHVATCSECTQKLKECPVCRQTISGYRKVYLVT